MASSKYELEKLMQVKLETLMWLKLKKSRGFFFFLKEVVFLYVKDKFVVGSIDWIKVAFF